MTTMADESEDVQGMIGRLRVEPAIPWTALVARAVTVLRDVAGEAG